MKKTKTSEAKTGIQKFDRSSLSPDELNLLEQFRLRRVGFEQQIEESNLIYHKHTCASCGFPSLNARGDFELCVICEWEDDGSDKDELSQSLVNNNMCLIEARIYISRMLSDFEKQQKLDYTLDKVIRDIRNFENKREEGQVQRVEDFNAHLACILQPDN